LRYSQLGEGVIRDWDAEAQPPLYNIGSVARLAGVSPGTLRNWEARFGVPSPIRTAPNGHRLYTQAEAALARMLAERVAAGTPIRKAAAAVAVERRTPVVLAAAFGRAALQLDDAAARRVVTEAATVLPPHRVWREVAAPTLHSLGERWAATGEGIAAEHLATEVMRGSLYAALGARRADGAAPLVVVACGPGERHELGSLVLTLLLRDHGVHAVYLGADTPSPALAEARTLPGARVLVVTAVTLPSARRTAEALVGLAAHTQDDTGAARLAYSGPGFADAAPVHDLLRGRAFYMGGDLDTVAIACAALVDLIT
jgi:DNA-binding transcriptional MerR regulator